MTHPDVYIKCPKYGNSHCNRYFLPFKIKNGKLSPNCKTCPYPGKNSKQK